METTIIKVIHLQRLDMFADIPSEQLVQVANICRETRYDKNEIIYGAGDRADAMYIIVEGAVKITRHSIVTRKVSVDEAFGIWGFFDRKPRLYTAQALENTCLLRIDSTEFFDLIEGRIHVSRGLIKFLVKSIRNLVEFSDQLA